MGLPYAEVIGDPIAHSKSPIIHNRWLALLAIPGEYRATKVSADELPAFMRLRRSDPDWRGCNVTIPHKQAVLAELDRVDEAARTIGAANCIVPQGGRLLGVNTDVDGVAAALDGITLAGRKAVLIGGGGAARAALHYLVARHVREVVVLVRDPQRARALQELSPAGTVTVASLADAPALVCEAAVIINASPLGMSNGPKMPTDLLQTIGQHDAILFDMVYDPLVTPFLSVGHSSRRIDGITMLVGQAARAFELFFGLTPPADDARQLQDLLARPKGA